MKSLRKLFHGCWHLFWACVPGCGQMCQGYMKRGISQTVITAMAMFVAVFLEMGALAMLIVPLWLYSFFDSYNLRRLLREGAAPEDQYLFGLSDMDSRRLNQLIGKRGSLIGWLLVAMGLYSLYQTVARRTLTALAGLFPWVDWLYDLMVWDAPRILGTVLIIALGIWFIKGPKASKEDDGPVYTPPKDPGPPPAMPRTSWTAAEEEFHAQPEPKAPEPPQAPEVEPVTLTWKSEFEVERFEKELQEKEEGKHDGE